MRNVRTFFFAALLLAAPAGEIFAQAAPAKAGAQPAATPKGSAQPSATAAAAATSAPTAQPGDVPAAHEIATEVDAAMSDKAQALFKEGNAHFRAARYAQAQASYKAAWALDLRSPRVAHNLGLTELELHMYRDAAEHLAAALRLASSTDPKRPAIQSALGEARARVGTLNLKITHAGHPLDGVEIVDMETGKSYTTPLLDPIFVDPKKVSFRIRREGYESQEKVFDLKAGEETAAEVVLERPPNYLGGTAAPTATSTAPTTAPRSKLPGFIGIGIGAAALIAGGALVGIAAGQQSGIVKDAPKDGNGNPLCKRTAIDGEDAACADLRSRARATDTMGNVGVGVLIGGGVLAAAAALYLVIPSGKPPANSKSSRVVPVVSSEGGGLVWIGSF